MCVHVKFCCTCWWNNRKDCSILFYSQIKDRQKKDCSILKLLTYVLFFLLHFLLYVKPFPTSLPAAPPTRSLGLSKSFPLDNSLFDSWLAQSVQITADDMLSQWALGGQHHDKSGSLLSDQVGLEIWRLGCLLS